jgi:hypothetical protein
MGRYHYHQYLPQSLVPQELSGEPMSSGGSP